jgi:hypothetical protein
MKALAKQQLSNNPSLLYKDQTLNQQPYPNKTVPKRHDNGFH